jgi:3-phosphoshikimate 1-carboxyvinyltransferase
MGWSSSSAEPLALASGIARGVVRPPGSKSATNRWINLAILGRRPIQLRGALISEDTELFFEAARRMGIATSTEADGVALNPGPLPAAGDIHCGNGGTMTRFLTATTAVTPGRWTLDGVERLRERPIGELVEALRRLGAVVRYAGNAGFVPVEIEGRVLAGGRTYLEAGSSSQFLSALLMAGQVAQGPWEIEVRSLSSAPYVELTCAALASLGGQCERTSDGFRTAPSELRGGVVEVEADLSAACYPAAAAALTGGRVEVLGVRRDSLQGDRRFFDLLEAMGCEVRTTEHGLSFRGAGLEGLEVDASDVPDQVPTLAAMGPFLRHGLVIRNAAHLRIKESNRLSAMVRMLVAAGAPASETADGLRVPGVWAEGVPPSGAIRLDPVGDHRIAMSAALLALRRPGLLLDHPGVVVKSYPSFWRDWGAIVQPSQ